MRNLVKMMMVMTALLVLSVGQLWAYPVANEATVSLQTYYSGVNGAFKVSDQYGQVLYPDGTPFLTFCVEMNVTFTKGTKYTATIDDGIKNVKNGPVSGSLHGGTKYLYWNFVQGAFAFNKDNVIALQDAIWMLQGDLAGNDSNTFYKDALDNVATGEGYDVKVMNLWTSQDGAKQSQLIAGSSPVPEPGTLLLLGSGLAGLALYRRRVRK